MVQNQIEKLKLNTTRIIIVVTRKQEIKLRRIKTHNNLGIKHYLVQKSV